MALAYWANAEKHFKLQWRQIYPSYDNCKSNVVNTYLLPVDCSLFCHNPNNQSTQLEHACSSENPGIVQTPCSSTSGYDRIIQVQQVHSVHYSTLKYSTTIQRKIIHALCLFPETPRHAPCHVQFQLPANTSSSHEWQCNTHVQVGPWVCIKHPTLFRLGAALLYSFVCLMLQTCLILTSRVYTYTNSNPVFTNTNYTALVAKILYKIHDDLSMVRSSPCYCSQLQRSSHY